MKTFLVAAICASSFLPPAFADQTVELKGDAGGKQFDGIGAVSGGGATSVLLKDYPEPQRSQVLDLLFKPKFGASMSALLVEVPGDGNSTQGAEPSHMHTKDDLNFSRGYEWWLMREAKKRNPDLTLDACAWGCPAWVGNGNFWSQDMCDYYVKWIQGLKSVYGLNLDAIGCRNEKGVSEDFAKKFRATLDAAGLENVKIHGFDNWAKGQIRLGPAHDQRPGAAQRRGHFEQSHDGLYPTPPDVQQLADEWNKPIWNTEEHVYKKGFDCEISLVQAFNENFLNSGVTKIVNWYLVGSVYPMESYSEDPAAMIANSPWSGFYHTREVLWGYAHYGQFSKIGWTYLNGACGKLNDGGTFVTLKSPGKDYSVILETKDAKSVQNVTFNISGGLSTGKLCVWRSDAKEQFVKQADIAPKNGSFTIALEPQSVYSISTTTGQQKGSFDNVPAEQKFPFPYYETFDEYASPKQFGYLPHYTADIADIFEIAERPDGNRKMSPSGRRHKTAKLGARMDALHHSRRRALAGLRGQRRHFSGRRRLGRRDGPRPQCRRRLWLRAERILFAAGGRRHLHTGRRQRKSRRAGTRRCGASSRVAGRRKSAGTWRKANGRRCRQKF